MNLHPDDPRLSAFVFGELSAAEHQEVARAVAANAALGEAVAELRELAATLERNLKPGPGEWVLDAPRVARVLGAARQADAAQRRVVRAGGRSLRVWLIGAAAALAASLAIIFHVHVGGDHPLVDGSAAASDTNPSFRLNPRPAGGSGGGAASDQRRARIAALTPMAAPVGIAAIDPSSLNEPATPAPPALAGTSPQDEAFFEEVKREAEQGPLPNPGDFPELTDQQFLSVGGSVDVPLPLLSGGSSWTWIRRFIDERHVLPPVNAVRIEEMLNAFPAAASSPASGLAMAVEVAEAPWNPELTLAMVRVFNPTPDAITATLTARLHAEGVSAFRLIGYARLRDGSAADPSATLAPGTSHLLLVEMRTRGAASPAVEFHLHCDSPVHANASTPPQSFAQASQDFRFATLIASFGKALRAGPNSPETTNLRLVSEAFAPANQDQAAAAALVQRALVLLEN